MTLQDSADFNTYYSNSQVEALLKDLAARYPELLEIGSIGESHEKRPLWLVTLTNRATGAAERKPALWADANLHATEVAGTTVLLCLISTLLKLYEAGDEQARRILDLSAIYLAPRLCPDGAERIFLTQPEFVRSGIRPYPYPEADEGLHVEDIDRDGRILQMRVRDPNGDWKISSLHPELMEKRRPHENGGQYYRLFPEGVLLDYDGTLVRLARERSYLDFNRNFPYLWRTEGSQVGAGPYPVSEPEVRAVVDFVSSHKNINLALLYHTYGGLLLRPFDDKGDESFETRDLWVYEALGQLGTDLTGYAHGSTSKLLRYHPKEFISGTEDAWMYDNLGIFAWTVELWNLASAAGVSQPNQMEWYRNHPHADDVTILEWYRKNVRGADAYVSWYSYDHPQLGKVELGGWNKLYAFRNPPHELMGDEAKKNVLFAAALAGTLPRVAIERCEVTAVGKGGYHVLLVVENAGFLPTFTSEQAKKNKAIRPVRLELELPEGCVLISGKRKQEIGHLEGRSNKLSVSSFGFDSSEMDNRGRGEWVIKGPENTQIRIHVESERAGSITHSAVLKDSKRNSGTEPGRKA